MSFSDLSFVAQWWLTFFILGLIFLPATTLLFSGFFDKGYIFSKILGMAFVSYALLLLGMLKLLPFTLPAILFVLACFACFNWRIAILNALRKSWRIFAIEELIFFVSLTFWSLIRTYQPDINGLEKFMDFGFVNSIARTEYFPPKDMWLTPFSINYYYFGHLVTAFLTKLSGLPSYITYNLMVATIFALTFTGGFSLGANLIHQFKIQNSKFRIAGGLITAFILAFAGNLQSLYAFFKPYPVPESPLPFWQLPFLPSTFPNGYWYPNATRFIENTIHEFPLYSFVVSDLHGHVLDIPFVLLTIAILFSLFFKSKLEIGNWKLEIPLISFLLAVMYMTNAWDGIIYFALTALILAYLLRKTTPYLRIGLLVALVFIGIIIFSLPFNLGFKPFASGIGLLCTPQFLTDMGKLGPFLFETDHCQRSPLWQFFILYGFFYFWAISFIAFLKLNAKRYTLNASDIFVFILIIFSTLLIIIPEFIYVKDIYPAHYRANTMFKLVYQSFIMLSISSGYIMIRLFLSNFRWKFVYWVIGLLVVLAVFLYPYFAISSYYDFKTYRGLDGISYIKILSPQTYKAILWINKNIKGQPVILEAQGDSYTDYGRISANTGLPTVLGWTVHEWLWRGSYDIPSPRISDIIDLYESSDAMQTKSLLGKYNVALVFVGDLERQKYPNLNEGKFRILGTPIYQDSSTTIYKITGEDLGKSGNSQ